MTPSALQARIAVVGALLASALAILKYFNYRTRRDRISLVGQAFSSTVDGLSSDAEAKKLAAAILLRRFFDKETEQGAAGAPYEREAVAVIAALLRNTPTGELQKLLADGLAYAPIDLSEADLFHADLTGASLRGAVARDAVFYTAIAREAVFEEAHLEGADFRESDLQGARFAGAWLERARFAGALHVPPNVARLLDDSGRVPPGHGMPVPSE